MARTEKATSRVAEVQSLLDGVAKNLVERLYGPDGPAWGTKLTELEDTAVEIRDHLSERLLHHALTRQAASAEQRPSGYQNCPGCGGCPVPDDPEPRIVQTRGGDAEWLEPREYCRKCRQAFFPSVSESGD